METNVRKFIFIIGIIVTLAVIALALLFTFGTTVCPKIREEIITEFSKGLIQLIVIGTLGLVVKLLIDRYTDTLNKQKQENEKRLRKNQEEIAYLKNFYNELMGENKIIRKGRSLILANRSVKSYGIQMNAIMDSKFKINELRHELILTTICDKSRLKEIDDALDCLEKYLKNIIDEFRREYKNLSELQRQSPSTYSAAEIWEKLSSLKELKGFLDDQKNGSYQKKYVSAYFKAKNNIQAKLIELMNLKNKSANLPDKKFDASLYELI